MSEDIPMEWTDDGSFKPINSFWSKRADRQYVVGMRYHIDARQERSEASHRAYFAQINEAHTNLPEDLAERFPTADHLRRWALVRAGYYDERDIAAASPAEARKIAAFVRPMDPFAVIVVRNNIVQVLTAKSQSFKAMGKVDFQKSKDATLDIIATILGVEAKQLTGDQAA